MKLLSRNLNEKLIFATQILLANFINRKKVLSDYRFKNILCIKLDEIGDVCYALHVFDHLKEKYPDALITLLCKSYCNTLVMHHPAINKVVNTFDDLNQRFDLIIDLRGSWKSIWYSLFHFPFAYIERGSVRLRNKKLGGHPHEVYTNQQIIQPLFKEKLSNPQPKLYLATQNYLHVEDYLKTNKINNFAIIHPGARKPLKKWDFNRYVQIAIWLNQTYSLQLIFAGDSSETEFVEMIQKQIPFKTYSIAGVFNLSDFAALVKKAVIYLGNDSGPLSIASVSGTPSLGLFGPAVPHVFYPFGSKTAYIHYIMPCNPCDQIHCVSKNDNCMDKISVMEVQHKIKELLA